MDNRDRYTQINLGMRSRTFPAFGKMVVDMVQQMEFVKTYSKDVKGRYVHGNFVLLLDYSGEFDYTAAYVTNPTTDITFTCILNTPRRVVIFIRAFLDAAPTNSMSSMVKILNTKHLAWGFDKLETNPVFLKVDMIDGVFLYIKNRHLVCMNIEQFFHLESYVLVNTNAMKQDLIY